MASIIRRQFKKTILDPIKLKEIVHEWQLNTPLDILSVGMDIFLLARLFTQFDVQKMSRGPWTCRSFQKIKNAILYCGDYHAKFYEFFFQKYFFVTPKIQILHVKKNNIVSQCIELNEPFDFFEPLA